MSHFQVTVSEIEDFPEAQLRRLQVTPLGDAILPSYQAGQYALLEFPGFPPRPYSIATAPGQDHLEFHIRQSDKSSASGASLYATTTVRVGDTLKVTAPLGACLYVADCTRPIIAVAGGSGVAGMKAIVEEALADPLRTAPVTLYCGARTRQDLYLDDLFSALAEADLRFKYIPVLSEDDHPAFRQGFVTNALIEDIPDLTATRIYGAGPLEMLRHLTKSALACGASAAHIHTDLDHTTLNFSAEATSLP